MDAVVLAAVVRELTACLPGARVDKVYQPAAETLILRLWSRQGELRLLLSAAAGQASLHLTGRRFPNPPAPPRFCQLLRNRLGRLVAVEQTEGERVVRLQFLDTADQPLTLVVELFGAAANLLLLDQQGVIIDALKRVGDGDRPVMPGKPYPALLATGRMPFSAATEQLPVDAHAPESFLAWVKQNLTAVSPLALAVLASGLQRGIAPQTLLADYARRMADPSAQPALGLWKGKAVLIPFPHPELEISELQSFATMNQALEAYSELAEKHPGRGSLAAELAKLVKRSRQRLQQRLEKLHQEEAMVEKEEEFGQWGSLLLASLHQLKKGQVETRLENYFLDPPQPVLIPLDPKRSPQENAAGYFQKAKKCRRGREHIHRRLQETAEELQWLDDIELALEEASEAADWESIRGALVEAGMLRQQPGRSPRRSGPELPAGLHQGLSPGGFRLFWGKNPRSNDYVSRQLTARDDLWFHAQGLPGCHLVLKRDGRAGEVPEPDRLFAAALAAGYSRGRNEQRVEVIQASGSAVRKPKGARPGLVTVQQFSTLLVAPRRLEGE
jgi:predicted ribosome quality control (RQC) complex YloA/Tae2 family protein